MSSELNYLTKEGFDKLKSELIEMKGKGRNEIAQSIQRAREMGDLSENAEYDAAKDAQGLLELKISKLETIIANARILDEGDIDISKAFILATVKLKNLKNNAIVKYTLVAEQEADIKIGKISVKSPVGKAILGKGVGEIVEIQAPSGSISLKLLEITR